MLEGHPKDHDVIRVVAEGGRVFTAGCRARKPCLRFMTGSGEVRVLTMTVEMEKNVIIEKYY